MARAGRSLEWVVAPALQGKWWWRVVACGGGGGAVWEGVGAKWAGLIDGGCAGGVDYVRMCVCVCVLSVMRV